MQSSVAIIAQRAPIIVIGFLPYLSLSLGKLRQPTTMPKKKEVPISPLSSLDAQVRSYCSIQLLKFSSESGSSLWN